ncbi:MAG: hypothetical protein AB7P07_03145 [Hyphomonadaceae bacterium]
MLTRRGFAGLTALTGAAFAAAAHAQSTSGRRAEVEALRRFAETTHPRGREAAIDADWRARWEALAGEADTLGDGAYFHRSRAALGWFKDGHTTVLPFEFTGGVPAQLASGPFAVSLPLRVRLFHDGAYVVAAKDEAAHLLGARVTHVGGNSVEDLIRAWARDWPGNDAWAHRWAGHAVTPAFLQALGAVADARAPLTIEAHNGRRSVRATLRPRANGSEALQSLDHTQTQAEAWAAQTGFGNFAWALPEHRALYLSVDDMADIEGKTFEAFTHEAFAAMEDTRADRLVIDLRRNGGGNNFLMEPLRKRILRSHFNRAGGLYVLTSPMTFSAAQNPCTRLERDSFVLFVGEPTGGAPNHEGDAQPFVGEATGLTSIVSTLRWYDSYPMDDRVWIMPDLLHPLTFADWRAGRDLALQAALTHEAPASDELDRARIFFYRRPSQEQAWAPFWRPAS